MKKSILVLLAGLALGLTACDDDIKDRGMMQTSPQQPIISADGWSVNLLGGFAGSLIDLEDYAPAEFIPMATVTAPTLPEDAVVSLTMMLQGANENEVVVDLVKNDQGIYGLSAESWDEAFHEVFGKAPFTQENFLQYAAYVTINNQLSRVGTPETWFAPTQVYVTPMPLDYVVEPAYYILLSNVGDGTINDAIKMDHSDQNEYDDPTFSVSITVPDVPETGFQWYIIPESAYNEAIASGSAQIPQAGWWQAQDPTMVSGTLIESATPVANTTNIAGDYLFSINMHPENGDAPTYDISLALDYLYCISNELWGAPLFTYDHSTFQGFEALTAGFYLSSNGGEALPIPGYTPTPSLLNATVWGQTETEDNGKITSERTTDSTPTLQKIYSPANAGLFWVSVNVSSNTYTLLPIEYVSLIGVNNDWDNDIELTPSANFKQWTGEVTFSEAGSQFKFRTNNAWGNNPNLGAGEKAGVAEWGGNNAGNIDIPGVGTYNVTLNLGVYPYTYTFKAK